MNRYTLRVGGSAKVRIGFFSCYTILYAGQVSPSSYSVVVTWTRGYNSLAYNLFLAEGQREFSVGKGRVTVERISPGEIEFTYYT